MSLLSFIQMSRLPMPHDVRLCGVVGDLPWGADYVIPQYRNTNNNKHLGGVQ